VFRKPNVGAAVIASMFATTVHGMTSCLIQRLQLAAYGCRKTQLNNAKGDGLPPPLPKLAWFNFSRAQLEFDPQEDRQRVAH
jgi:hypothetical protein